MLVVVRGNRPSASPAVDFLPGQPGQGGLGKAQYLLSGESEQAQKEGTLGGGGHAGVGDPVPSGAARGQQGAGEEDAGEQSAAQPPAGMAAHGGGEPVADVHGLSETIEFTRQATAGGLDLAEQAGALVRGA